MTATAPTTNPNEPNPNELLADGVVTIPAALALAGCGRTTLYGAIARGELPTVHHGRRTTIPRRALVDWLAARMRRRAGESD